MEEFLNSNDKITSEDLNALEKEVINAIDAKNTSTFKSSSETSYKNEANNEDKNVIFLFHNNYLLQSSYLLQ